VKSVPGRKQSRRQGEGQGYIVRCGLEEAQSESARRRTGIGYEVWHTQDELARDNEVLHLRKGVLYKSGVYAWKVLCLTPGDLFADSRLIMRQGPDRFPADQEPGAAVVADCCESERRHKRWQQLMRNNGIRSGNVCGERTEVSRGHNRSTRLKAQTVPERGLNERRSHQVNE